MYNKELQELVERIYNISSNIKIEYSDKVDKEYVAIYFSSHGIWSPTNQETFQSMIIEKDRYEWRNNKISCAYKHIFVRDIFKQWYIRGINSKCNDINKLVEYLKEETKGKKIITIGSSAGGYASILLGCLLRAEKIYSFSPQINLNQELRYSYNKILRSCEKHNYYNKYFNLIKYIKDYKGKMYIFYSNAKEDKVYIEELINNDIVNIFKFKNKKHGIPFFVYDIEKVISNQRLESLYDGYVNKDINRVNFSYKIGGIKHLICSLLFEFKFLKKKIIKKIHSYKL